MRLGADGPADPREETNARDPGHALTDTPPGGARRKAAAESWRVLTRPVNLSTPAC